MKPHDVDCQLCSRSMKKRGQPKDRFWVELWYLLFAGSALVILVWLLSGRTL